MPPNINGPSEIIKNGQVNQNVNVSVVKESDKPYKVTIVWRNVIIFILLHLAGLYGMYLYLFYAKWSTLIFVFIIGRLAGLGITAGAHRLWSHRSYKAKLPLRIMLMILNSMALQNSIYEWSRDHRVHHKYTETDADPHNVKRGAFFAHMGWLLVKKHPDVINKGKNVDLSDLEADPVVMFQKKYYKVLSPLMCFVFPPILNVYLCNETWTNAYFISGILTYITILHYTWFVNSWAHLQGHKPYDKDILAAENIAVAILALGEGWHNYHHVFPWDYKTAELGWGFTNATTVFINLMAKIGWAYDLKEVNEEIIKKRVLRTGDGSHVVWGYGDKDLNKDHVKRQPEATKEQCEPVWGMEDKDFTKYKEFTENSNKTE